MKSRWIVLAIALIVVSFGAYSQISSNIKVTSNKINDKFTVEEKHDCTYSDYYVDEPVYGNVTRTRPVYSTCFNIENQSNYTCESGSENYDSFEQVGTNSVTKTKEDCHSKSFVIVQGGSRKEIDFSAWRGYRKQLF